MSDTTPTDDDLDLGSFEGDTISRATIKVTGAGDGLSEAMKIETRKLHKRDEVYVVMRCRVTAVGFEDILVKGDPVGTARVHKLKAQEAVIVEDEHVAALLATHAERIAEVKEQERLARERERGVRTLDDGAILLAHAEGEHDSEPVEGCEVCERIAADEAEEGDGS